MLCIRLSMPLTFSYYVLLKHSIAFELRVFLMLEISFDDISEGVVSWEIG